MVPEFWYYAQVHFNICHKPYGCPTYREGIGPYIHHLKRDGLKLSRYPKVARNPKVSRFRILLQIRSKRILRGALRDHTKAIRSWRQECRFHHCTEYPCCPEVRTTTKMRINARSMVLANQLLSIRPHLAFRRGGN